MVALPNRSPFSCGRDGTWRTV